MKQVKVMTVFGTRPEAIKMAPIVLALQQRSAEFIPVTVVTAQHREMLDQVLATFNITPDYDLNVMHQRQTLTDVTTNVLQGMGPILEKEQPDIMLVHGDTTTTLAASLAGFYHHVAVGHVEAGLRTWDKNAPYPEELNRQMTDDISDLYFAPTQLSKENLLKENHPEKNIYITGNTAIDALQHTVRTGYQVAGLPVIPEDHRLILLTMHRRENQGAPMERVFKAIRHVVETHSDVEVVYPVHLNPAVQEVAHKVFNGLERVHLIEPLEVVDFHNLAAQSYFIMTDSGGVQEEAPALKKPVLVLRDVTERPEGVQAGTLRLVGTETAAVTDAMIDLLTNTAAYQKMATARNPYGDGHATERILAAIQFYFNGGKRPAEFGQ
ncbi:MULTISPECIES: non-hydrolyzing UDP-N-acetylglucosamine 2-epimerase [unclassified Ligilactobacillus]|uniref:non-hydrolyzing UDP-N-acetylglucosamine 2-epimerase n=1 Tax=unclassified Ligilactobacillus TaxID=2767920 RepID=UPI0038538039